MGLPSTSFSSGRTGAPSAWAIVVTGPPGPLGGLPLPFGGLATGFAFSTTYVTELAAVILPYTPGTSSPRSRIGTSRPNGGFVVGFTKSAQIQPRGRIWTHGFVQPLPLAVWVQLTRVSIAMVPMRLASSPARSRTPTVRTSSSDRVPSGNAGAAAVSSWGPLGTGGARSCAMEPLPALPRSAMTSRSVRPWPQPAPESAHASARSAVGASTRIPFR